MRLSTVILPIYPWKEGRRVWRRAEELGFHTAYTYDHLSWREPFHEGPWFGAVPTLTAAAGATGHIRLGTLVASVNFRHPVAFAKELMTLDDVSGGRVELGIGAGATGPDATVLGGEAWSARERTERFEEFLPLLDRLLTEPVTSFEGRFYSAHEARNIPGCVQRPRLPFTVAGSGPRGMRLAARYGQGWVTNGVREDTGITAGEHPGAIRAQLDRLREACERIGRDADELHKVFLVGYLTPERPLASFDAFVDFAGRYQEIGIDEISLHWPVQDSMFEADMAVFERVATEGLLQLG
jgi:alkanesulfonate monooxygenase SsuD/methylene tetrahydromethanopterin reductase-like flavin-dependent oxidoreductase (luciferase family)